MLIAGCCRAGWTVQSTLAVYINLLRIRVPFIYKGPFPAGHFAALAYLPSSLSIQQNNMDEKIESHAVSTTRHVESSTLIKPQARKPYDTDVSFEEYHYYAQKTRREELTLEPPVLNVRQFFGKNARAAHGVPENTLSAEDFTDSKRRIEISDEEWTNASRAVRSASWGACMSNLGSPNVLHKLTTSRLLSHHNGHSGTIWIWFRNGHFGMGPR